MKETLLTRLASYSQNPTKKSLENFTTEVLAYLINHDDTFRSHFIRHIIPDGRIQRCFTGALADSQQDFGNSIVDLVLSAGGRRVLVEVKIAARETETKIYGKGWVPQVQKYLDLNVGPVAYLTTKSVSPPDVRRKGSSSKRYLGQFFFEDLYDQIVRSPLTDVGKMFRQFMEENGMKSLEPFTQKELDNAGHAFEFAEKCEAFLDQIRPVVESEFRRLFRTRTRFTRGCFSPSDGSAYMKTTNFRRGFVKRVGIYFGPEDGKLIYGVYVRVLRTGIGRLRRHLKWPEEGGFLSSFHPVRPDTKSRRLIEPILRDLRKLKGALNRVY
jgi:hypothetical protein